MKGDRICLDGNLVPPAEAVEDIDSLLSGNYAYQDIQTFGYSSPYLEEHLRIAGDALLSIHGRGTLPSAGELGAALEALLRENRYPAGSTLVRLYLMPERWMLSCVQQQLYEEFALWHSRLKAITVQYVAPFASRQCAVSLMCARVADDYAVRCGAEVAVRSDRDGVLSSSGDRTLVAVRERIGYLTPTGSGAPEDVYRGIAESCFRRAGMALHHEPIAGEGEWDEMMVFGPQGIISLKSLDERMFYNTAALKLSLALPK